MAAIRYVFTVVPGHSVGRRAIGFLEEEQDVSSLGAKSEFDSS